MARKEFTFKGKTIEELQGLNHKEFQELVTARQRRSLKRGISEEQKGTLKKLKSGKQSVKTHRRDIIVLPEMVNKTVRVHNGKEFIAILISAEMLGHYLGEFVMTRKRVQHHAPGIGATRSSASLSVK